MLKAQLNLFATLSSPRLLGIVIRKLGVRDRIPVMQETQIIYVETGEVALRV